MHAVIISLISLKQNVTVPEAGILGFRFTLRFWSGEASPASATSKYLQATSSQCD